jgi:hypothetical protein
VDVQFSVRVKEITRELADSREADLDVGIGAGIFGTVPRAPVCVDVDVPSAPPPMFVRASVEFLPFRNGAFETVKAYNVLEHVPNPRASIREILRVGSALIARQDSWMCLAIWATPEHEWLQLPGFRFLRFPRTRIGVQMSKNLRKVAMTPRYARLISKAHLLFRWKYYSVEAERP